MIDNKLALRNLVREPLFLFVVISLLIFLVDALRPDQAEDVFEAGQSSYGGTDLTRIEVDENLLIALQEEFNWLRGRAPTSAEMDEMVSDWLEEEMIFRHTLMTEQHLNDGKVREHMIEKISLLWAGLPDDPTDEQVLQHYMDNIEFYYSEPRASFVHVFFNQLPDDSAGLAERLNAGEEITGEPYWLGNNMDAYAESILRTSFGGDFYQAVVDAPLNTWIGPLTSPRGFHYVIVSQKTPPEPLKFQDIYARVRQGWLDAEQRRLIAEQVEQLKPQFNVVSESSEFETRVFENQGHEVATSGAQ